MITFTRIHALLLLPALAPMIPSQAPAQPVPPFKLQTTSWYLQVGLLINPSNGPHLFMNPPAGPGPWCTPAELILNGSESVRARDYPLCPASDGALERTRHDSAPHANDLVPSAPWEFDITCALPNPGPFAVETRVSGSRTHPGANHTDLYTAVVGALLGTVPGPSIQPRFVIIHGSMGKHIALPPPPSPSPIAAGCHLTPPSGQPSSAGQDYPMGQVTTIIDPADGKLLLMLVVEGMSQTNIGSVYVRDGAGGPILTDLRPLMQTRQLDQYAWLLFVPDLPVPPSVAEVMAAGNAFISVATSAHPDGEIVGALTPTANSSSYQVQLQPGWNVVANQLSTGSNSLGEVLPSVPPGSVFYQWNASNQTYTASTFDPDFGGWDNPSLNLRPGEGGFVKNSTSSPFTVTFVGEVQTPHLPLSLPPGQLALVARQIPAPATYEQITGLAPADGTKLYRYDPALQVQPFSLTNWQAYTFSQGQWTPGTPSVGIGEPVFIQVPTNSEPIRPSLSIQGQGSNVVVSLSGSGILQSADQLGSSLADTPWTRFSNLNPWVEPLGAGTRFYSAMSQDKWPWKNLIRNPNGRLGFASGGGGFTEIPFDEWSIIKVPPGGFDVQGIDPVTKKVFKTYHLRDLNGDGVFSGAGEVTTTTP